MPSLPSIPGEEVLDTSSRRSNFNSKKSKTQSSSETRKKRATDSRAESITESQKTRVTACSKLMEEAKCIGEALEALRLDFDSTNNRFSENVRERNKDTFDAW